MCSAVWLFLNCRVEDAFYYYCAVVRHLRDLMAKSATEEGGDERSRASHAVFQR